MTISRYWTIAILTTITALPTATYAEDAVTFDAHYLGEIWSLAKGGLEKDTRYMDNLDLQLTIDASNWGLEGGTFFFYGMYNNNTVYDGDLMGTHQGLSNIENTQLFRLEEAWYEQAFMGGKASLKLGLIDLNSEFDAIDPAGFFINPSHGIGVDYSQSGLNGPSIFPSTSMAMRFNVEFGDGWSFRTGIFDGEPNNPDKPKAHEIKFNKGALIATELNKNFGNDWRFGLGTWHYTKQFDRFAPTSSGDTADISQGIYAFVHGPIAEDMDMWMRYGRAASKANPYESYMGAGIVKTGTFQGRDDDQIGFAIARASNGDPFMASEARSGHFMDRTETNFELSYRAQINDTFALQPDLQYFINPGTSPDIKNALAIGLRLEIAFSM